MTAFFGISESLFWSFIRFVEGPRPQVITPAAPCPNMNDKIQIERDEPWSHTHILVNREIQEIIPKKRRVFAAKVDRSGGDNACWPWTGGRNRDGYGYLAVRGKYIGAHRMAYQLHHGPIEKGVSVLHNCPGGDNPACCNPAHLWLGTQTDNILDMEEKGRAKHPAGMSNGLRKHPESVKRGTLASNAILNDEKVREIRRLYHSGTISVKEIAEKYGVTSTCIGLVGLRKSWRHVV